MFGRYRPMNITMQGSPTNYSGMMGQLQNPYMKPTPAPSSPWGNFMQSPESFGGQFDNRQILPWLRGQFNMAQNRQGPFADPAVQKKLWPGYR